MSLLFAAKNTVWRGEYWVTYPFLENLFVGADHAMTRLLKAGKMM